MASDQPFQPSLGDVLVVRSMLSQAVILPELVGTILDYAEYWVRSCSTAQLNEIIRARWTTYGDYQGSKFLLRSFPVGLTENAIHREEDDDEHQDGNSSDSGSSYSGDSGSSTSSDGGSSNFSDGDSSNFGGSSDFSDSGSSISVGQSYETATIPPAPIPIDEACDRAYFRNLIRNPPTQPHPVRKIVFRIVSHDQGWTTDDPIPGPFIVARTWFDAGIERFDASHSCNECKDMRKLPLCKLRTVESELNVTIDDAQSEDQYARTPFQGPREIQRNKMADGNFQTYVTTWTCWDVYAPDSEEARRKMEEGKGRMNGDGSFVRSLGLGDVVTVWGRALYAGWVNVVESVEIEIYWAL